MEHHLSAAPLGQKSPLSHKKPTFLPGVNVNGLTAFFLSFLFFFFRFSSSVSPMSVTSYDWCTITVGLHFLANAFAGIVSYPSLATLCRCGAQYNGLTREAYIPTIKKKRKQANRVIND